VADVMQPDSQERRQNRRTALVLASVVLIFFLGVIARRYLIGG